MTDTSGSTNGFVSELETDAKEVVTAVEGVFTEVVTAAEIFLRDLASSIAANGGTVLINAAVAAVQAAETTGGSGSAKLSAAQASVLNVLSSQGLPLLTSAVNGAIEGAVASLKAPAVAAPAA